MSLTPPTTGSKLHIYGIGIVAANKDLSSKIIEVTPIEALPMLDGEITDNMQEVTTKGSSASGETYEASVNTTASIQAEWLPLGSSGRMTAPDVRRGEHVVLYKFGDTDKYYWITLWHDMKLRKLETVVWAFSNTQKESDDGNADTTYFLEISTHKKIVHFHTSKSDGEPFAYDLQLNTKDGVFTFQDDIGNYVQIDSKNVRIEIKNADGSHIDMDKRVITITAPETINVIAGETINMQAPAINTQSDKTTNNVPETLNTGHITGQGGIAISGGEGAAVSGNINATGGDIKADDISLKDHGHMEQGDGNRTGNAVV